MSANERTAAATAETHRTIAAVYRIEAARLIAVPYTTRCRVCAQDE